MCCVGWHGLVPTELADREALFSSCPSSYPTSTFWGWLMGGREEEGWVLFFKTFSPLLVVVCVCVSVVRAAAIQPTEQTHLFLFLFYLWPRQRHQTDKYSTSFIFHPFVNINLESKLK